MVTWHAWVTAVPEWPHCVAALGGDETLGLAGLLVILECDGAQGVLPPSWPKAMYLQDTGWELRVGTQAASGLSFRPWVGTLPANCPVTGMPIIKLCPALCHSPETPTASRVIWALSSPCMGLYWGVATGGVARGRVPSMTTRCQEPHCPVARGPADPSDPKYIKGMLGSKGPATGCRRDQGLPLPSRGFPEMASSLALPAGVLGLRLSRGLCANSAYSLPAVRPVSLLCKGRVTTQDGMRARCRRPEGTGAGSALQALRCGIMTSPSSPSQPQLKDQGPGQQAQAQSPCRPGFIRGADLRGQRKEHTEGVSS